MLIPNGDSYPIGSRFVWEQTNNYLQQESGNAVQSISRASVINFLEALRKRELLKGILTTGKGGKRYLYKYHLNRDQFNHEVSEMLVASLVQEYPKVNLMHITRVAMSEAGAKN